MGCELEILTLNLWGLPWPLSRERALRKRRFLERFPTIADLAAASEDEVLAAWSGLGYYRRARSLRAAAQRIRDDHGGALPEDLEDVLALATSASTPGTLVDLPYDWPQPFSMYFPMKSREDQLRK